MEVPRLGAESQPMPQPHQCQVPAYMTAHGTARSSTHWARSGIKPESSWILYRVLNPLSHKGNCYNYLSELITIAFQGKQLISENKNAMALMWHPRDNTGENRNVKSLTETTGTCCTAQGIHSIFCDNLSGKQIWKRMDVCMCIKWITLLYSRNYHNTVNQVYLNKTLKIKKSLTNYHQEKGTKKRQRISTKHHHLIWYIKVHW